MIISTLPVIIMIWKLWGLTSGGLCTTPIVFASVLALRSSRCHRPREFSSLKESGILRVESQPAGAHGKVKVLLEDRSAQSWWSLSLPNSALFKIISSSFLMSLVHQPPRFILDRHLSPQESGLFLTGTCSHPPSSLKWWHHKAVLLYCVR
jgi:hypothetical protein